MYAQNIEGDSWKGERLDKGVIDKMSGQYNYLVMEIRANETRSAVGPAS